MKVLKYFIIFLMISLIGGSFSFFHKPEKQCDSIYEIIEAEELKEVIESSEEEFVFDFEEATSGMSVRTLDDSELNGHLNISYNEAIVVAEGKAFEGNANINGGMLIVYGTLTPKHFNFNDGRLIILGDGELENININDEVENYGDLIIEKLNINSDGILINYGTLEINDYFNNNSAFINNKEAYINGNLVNNGNAEIENNSKLVINGELINNNKIINSNEIIVYFDLLNNGSGEIKNNGILSVGGEIKNYGKLEGNEIYNDFKRVEAEKMKLDDCKVEKWYYASGGKVIRAYKDNAKAEYKFNGDTGSYSINVRYLDVKGQESTFKLYVDDNMVAEWVDNESENKDVFRIKTFEKVYIEDGSKVILRLDGDKHSGAIVDYIEFEDICGTISGGFTVQEEDDVKFINILNDATADIKLVNTVQEDCILWMKGKLVDAEDIDLYVNDKKLAVRDNLYYFKWLKIGEFSNKEDISIRIVNKNALVNIDKFYFAKKDIAPFAGEYVIDDLLADIEGDDNVKILFSGENLKNADATLYRKMTTEAYYEYLKDKYWKISEHELISKVLSFFKKNNPEVIGTKKITDISEYSMLDDDPMDGYECEYFLRIDNCFGESLYSKKIFVLYEKDEHDISFRYDYINEFDDKYEEDNDGYKKKRFEAEDMKYKGFKYYSNKGASKGKVLQSEDNAPEAWFNFDGDDGTYYFKVRYLYGTDGDDAGCSVYVNNKKIDEWINERSKERDKYEEREIKEIKLKKGDRISFRGKWGRKRKGYFIFDCIDIIGKNKYLKNKNIYGFKREKDEVKYEPGFVVKTDVNEQLYINKESKIKDIPSILKDSYFYQGLKDLENIAFHANKFTDVFVYVPDKDRSYADYYYSKGFKLIKIPVELTSSTGDDFTYFYHKRYRAGTGDSLYLLNPKKLDENNNENDNFSVYVDKDDLIVHFNTEGTSLENSENIYIRFPVNYPEKNKGHPWGRRHLYYKNHNKMMRKIGENLWVYRIKDGAEDYDVVDFEFYNKHHMTESNPDWIWDKDHYLQELAKKASSVVFFKELEIDNYDVNFTDRYQSQYIGFEDYLIDDGTVYAAKGKELLYGLTHELSVNVKAFPSNDNAKGIYDSNLLRIDFSSLNSTLVDSDYIEIRYSFDNWATYETYMMQNIGYNKWEAQIYPPGGANNISFNFNNGSETDDNIGANWEWDFIKENYFNFGYERNLVKRNYISLPKYEDNTDDNYTWNIELDNGIYDVKLLVEKTVDDQVDQIEINGKTYLFNNNYKGLVEIRDQFVVFDKNIYFKNTGNNNINIYSISIVKDKGIISTGILKPQVLMYDGFFNDNEITAEIIEFENNNDLIIADFKFNDLTDDEVLSLVFNAVSNKCGFINIYNGDNPNDENIIATIKLDNDINEYSIDLTDFLDQIKANDDSIKISIKGNIGTKILTHISELATFGIRKYMPIEDDYEFYQGIGFITFDGTKYIFTEDQTGITYESYSNNLILSDYLDGLVMVTGYITNELLNIIKVDVFIKIISIEGDKYTNNQPLTWTVIANEELTQLIYRVNGVFEWTTIPFGPIVQEIPDDGEYILEVIPVKNNIKGLPYSYSFIVDRTGPQLTVDGIPDIIGESTFTIQVTYSDNYTPEENIKLYCKYGDAEEKELTVVDGTVSSDQLGLTGQEGLVNLQFYCTDELGNLGNIVSREVIVDRVPPTLSIDASNILKPGSITNERNILTVFLKDDNITAKNDIRVFYKVNDYIELADTTGDYVIFDAALFPDGEYQVEAYAVDKAGLQSDVTTDSFIIDTTPIDTPFDYNVAIEDGRLVLSWTSTDDPTFAYYQIRRIPEFDLNEEADIDEINDGHNYVEVGKSEFKDIYSLYNPDYLYYISVVDSFGNISPELECSPYKPQTVTGEQGEEKTMYFEDSSFTVTIEETGKPIKVGIVKQEININKHIQAEYNFIKNKEYFLAPEGTGFKIPAKWDISLSDIPEEYVEKKDNLTLYYYNRVRNRWEEVETNYNQEEDILSVKIHHFSDYAVGEKKDDDISEGNLSTNISPVDGSLNASLDLFSISSHQENFNLKLQFDTKKFDRMSRFVMTDYLKNKKEIECTYKIKLTDEAQDQIGDMKKDLQDLKENEDFVIICPFTEVSELGESTTEVMEYKKFIQTINQIDNAWDINLPELSKDDPTSDKFKYIKFEDGRFIELKPKKGMYRNIYGRRFIYKELGDDNGYLVRAELYKNYKFNKDGKIEYIFYANNAEEVVENIDLNRDKIIFTFDYDEDGILAGITSYNKLGQDVYKLAFNYTELKDIDDPTDDVSIKRISNISKSVKLDGTYKKLADIKLNYMDIKASDEVDNSYLWAYNQLNKKRDSSLFIHYERLYSVEYTTYDYEENVIETEVRSLNYEFEGDKYHIVDKENPDFPFYGTENIDIGVPFYKIGKYGGYYKYRTIDMNVEIEYHDVSLDGDYEVAAISGINVDEKQSRKEYNFKTYPRIANWNNLASFIFGYCTDQVSYIKDHDGNIMNETKLSKTFHYKKNRELGMTPFERTIQISQDRHYSLANREDKNTIDNRSFNLVIEPIPDRYIFFEMKIEGMFQVTSNRSGVFYYNYDYNEFNNRYFPVSDSTDDVSEELEDIVGTNNLTYKSNYMFVNSQKEIIGGVKGVKAIDSDEKIMQEEKYEYYYDKITRKYDYINSTDRKSTIYTYRQLSDYFGYDDTIKEEEEFLFTQFDTTKEEVESGVYKVHKNIYDRTPGGEVQVIGTEKYLSNDISKKLVMKFEYDQYNRINKEIIALRDTPDANGLLGKTSRYEYDNLNNQSSMTVIGSSKVLDENNNIVDGVIGVVKNQYYDKRNNKIIADEGFEYGKPDDKAITLYFYDNKGNIYKNVTFNLLDNAIYEKAFITITYADEIYKDMYMFSGSYNRYEDGDIYLEYFNNIKDCLNGSKSSNEYLAFQKSDYESYKLEIEDLANNNFDFRKVSFDFDKAGQVMHYLSYDLLDEAYVVKKSMDMSTVEKITKRFATFKHDAGGNKLDKITDDIAGYQKAIWEYDDLNNITKETFPDNFVPPKIYETKYNDYMKEIKESQGEVTKTQRYNNYNCVFYEKLIATDGSIDDEVYCDYNYAGQMIRKTSFDGIVAETEYNYYGIVKKTIDNPSDNIAKRNTSINVYNNMGKSIYTYSDILINSSSFNPETNWITKANYDDFGNIIKAESKPDPEILKEGLTPTNIILYKVFNGLGKSILETSNRYKLNIIVEDDKLGDVEYKYRGDARLDEKISYGWNPVDKVLITYRDKYEYDEYGRMLVKTKEYKNGNGPWELLEKKIVDELNEENKIIRAYQKNKGKNWIENVNKYDENGNVRIIISRVTDVAGDDFITPTSYLLTQKKIMKYDKYKRLIAEVDFDKTGKYIVYDDFSRISKEYAGINFIYDIVNDEISNIQLKSPIEYKYNEAGQKISEKIIDFNTSTVLYEKAFEYDKFGRVTSETIGKYNKQGDQKRKQVIYDDIGRIEKTIIDDYTETVLQWEDEDSPKIIKMDFNNGEDSISFTNEIMYSDFGNEVFTIDRDGYKFYDKYDLYGNKLESYKDKDGQNIFNTKITLDETSNFILSLKTISFIEQNISNNQILYAYDTLGRTKSLINYDLANDLVTTKELSKKAYQYNQADEIEKIDYYIGGEFIDDVSFDYNDFGVLERIIYPEDSIYELNYDEVNKDGRLKGVNFTYGGSKYNIIRDIEYLNNSSSIIKSFLNGVNIRTTLGYDNLNRINSINYLNTDNGDMFYQDYTYDKAGNITQVAEHRGAGSIVESLFTRDFIYDEYNRLIRAEYTGTFTHEVHPKLTYQNFDYTPKDQTIAYENLTDDGDKTVNIEAKSPSILISDRNGNEREIIPEIVRIYKNMESKLKDVMINTLYHDGSGFTFLEKSKYTIEDNPEFYELRNLEIDLTKILKLNLDLDNTDVENNPVIDHSLDNKLKDVIKFYTKVDNIDFEYTYDVMGNRLTKKQELSKYNREYVMEEEEDTYQYNDDKRLLLSDNMFTYEYDIAGQLIKKAFKDNPDKYWEYSWDSVGNLRKVTRINNGIEEFKEEYIYDETGKRIKTIAKDSYTVYIYDGIKVIYEKKVEDEKYTSKSLVYINEKLHAVFENDNGTLKTPNYYYSDILESTRFITDHAGNVVQENLFTPFGQELLNSLKSNVSKLHYQYATHHYQNEETGLTYMMGRWMDNSTGRFISGDPKKDDTNYYIYAGNNPTTFVDPDGYDFGISAAVAATIIIICVVVCAVIGSIIGGILGAIAGYKYAQQLSEKIKEQGGSMPSSWYTYHILTGYTIGWAVGLGAGAIAGLALGVSIVSMVGAAATAAVAAAGSATFVLALLSAIGGVFGILATGFTINYLTLQVIDMVVGLGTFGKIAKAVNLLLSTICGLTSTVFSLPSLFVGLADSTSILESILGIAGLGSSAYGWASAGSNNVFTDVFTYFATGDDTGVANQFFSQALGICISGVVGALMIGYGYAKNKYIESTKATTGEASAIKGVGKEAGTGDIRSTIDTNGDNGLIDIDAPEMDNIKQISDIDGFDVQDNEKMNTKMWFHIGKNTGNKPVWRSTKGTILEGLEDKVYIVGRFKTQALRDGRKFVRLFWNRHDFIVVKEGKYYTSYGLTPEEGEFKLGQLIKGVKGWVWNNNPYDVQSLKPGNKFAGYIRYGLKNIDTNAMLNYLSSISGKAKIGTIDFKAITMNCQVFAFVTPFKFYKWK